MSRPNNGNVAGAEGRRRCHDNVGGESGNLFCDCECVFECLLELLADALGKNDPCAGRVRPSGGSNGPNENNRRCFCVYECLYELLSDALEENNHHHHCPR